MTEQTAKASTMQPIETWQLQEQTPAHIFAGVKAANGWGQGKEMTLKDYQKAVKDFLKGPMTGGAQNG